MSTRGREHVYNFGAGPAALPTEVLEQVREDLLSYAGTGMSVMEISHRSAVYEQLQADAEAALRRLLGIPAHYAVLFLQGGASQQFAMVPMNLLPQGGQAGYVLTGSWSEKAMKEAQTFGRVRVVGSTKDTGYRRIPSDDELDISPDDAYVHITTNNTIVGSQWHRVPEIPRSIPLVADMSSDICSHPVDVARFRLIYAGAQKNLGPAGVTVVVADAPWLEHAAGDREIPAIFRYGVHVKARSTYNTPPTFAVYMVGLVAKWMLQQGGLLEMERRNRAKAEQVYSAIDDSEGFYQAVVEPTSRSWMNATFRLPTPALEAAFLERARAAGLVGLAGHRSVGGIRVSLYNAVPLTWCERLCTFMDDFRRNAEGLSD
ncbi:MAG: 3-phosphoserine/phosphohydroxythreonine transaminase [Alicyclobacillus sp.]|nr:3-phosphoserine/phosphohydroxythreonine transaminase [Alicyclobacillus sp.]